jgi:16S rRNA (cytosine967-C5)-methyltransferase
VSSGGRIALKKDKPLVMDEGQASRRAAIQLIASVLRGGNPLDEAAERSDSFLGLSIRDRSFAWLLTLSCLRHLGEIDAVISYCLKRALPERAHQVHDLLRLGAAQLLFTNIPPYAAVNSCVNLTEGQFAGYRNLVNAVLRRITREGKAYLETCDVALLNTPKWLWDSWVADYGQKNAKRIADAHRKEPPLDITPKDPEAVQDLVKGRRTPTESIRVPSDGPVAEMPGFSDGLWWVQDLAATLPVMMLGEVGGQQVIDLCAAPGGKTAQLCKGGATVVSLDVSAGRLETLKENLKRLSFNSKIVCADARLWRPNRLGKFVLLDAPCTGTGTIRRHPDILHRRTPDQVRRSAQLLDELLVASSEMLDIGGILVFSTCSLQREEGPQRINAFLSSFPGFVRDPIPFNFLEEIGPLETKEGDLRTLPCYLEKDGGMDGFFAARLKRIF